MLGASFRFSTAMSTSKVWLLGSSREHELESEQMPSSRIVKVTENDGRLSASSASVVYLQKMVLSCGTAVHPPPYPRAYIRWSSRPTVVFHELLT